MAPQVRELQALINEQNAALQPQYSLLDESISRNETAGAAQETGLAATKDKTFKQIDQGAQNKGMFFSGFSPTEQAEYTAGTYLPALAQLQATIAQTRSNLLSDKAKLGKSAFDVATGLRESDISRKSQWDISQEERRFQAEQAEADRRLKASEGAADRAVAVGNSVRSNSTSSSNQPSPNQMMAQALSSKTGSDGFVSPGTYSALKSQWTAGGYGDAKSFDSTFAGYRNPSNKYYKIG